mmetsp:Transcript_13498/g.36036  ORF Transcript_13498/g.36036 Transcript_13498/m.36036 type:complete len:163 (-) Transcript_13498:860-1348(-)
MSSASAHGGAFGYAPPKPVFADDVPPRRLVKPFDKSTWTAFERSAAPLPSADAPTVHSGERRHFGQHRALSTGWAHSTSSAGDAEMYVTTAQGGGVEGEFPRMAHGNGLRKLSTKRMVKPDFAQVDLRARVRAAQAQPANPVDQRIGAFAGSLALYSHMNRN